MEQTMRGVCADFECELAQFNGAATNVHLLVNFPPKVALSRFVNSIEGVSARRMRTEFPEAGPPHCRANKLRSGSYFAGSGGGAPISVLCRLHRPTQPPWLICQGTDPPGGGIGFPCPATRESPLHARPEAGALRTNPVARAGGARPDAGRKPTCL
ncbi:IS200/IS605 family transposase [Microbispora amethystogenes]